MHGGYLLEFQSVTFCFPDFYHVKRGCNLQYLNEKYIIDVRHKKFA